MRNFRAFGIAILAVLGMIVLSASSVQAATTTTFTPEGNTATTITGTQIAAVELTVGNRVLTCGKAHFSGEIAGNTTDVKIIPLYEECKTTPVLGISFPFTVTTNGCWYTFTGEDTIEAGKYGVSVHLECEKPGEEMVVHVKSGANDVCTVTIKPQTLSGMYLTNSGTSPDDVVLNLNGMPTNSTIHGSLCGGTGDTSKEFASVMDGQATVKGFQGGPQVNLTVSHLGP
jgi:hypothetical protein